MLKVLEDGQSVDDGRVSCSRRQVGHHSNATGVVLKVGVVEVLCHGVVSGATLTRTHYNESDAHLPDLRWQGERHETVSSHEAILDGELVAFDALGRPSFEALQQRMHVAARAQAKRHAAATPVTYVIFDLLWLDGHSLMALSYAERRELLAALKLTGASWRTPEHVLGGGAELLRASAEQGLEGILAKRLDSAYQPGLRS